VNNVVDVTNYVLLETGHPLHAFDYDKLEGQEIVVRRSKAGESIQTIDDKTRVLQETMLTICDTLGPVAVAGVMGGVDSEIQGQTRDIVLESAYFAPTSVRRTSKQLGLQTDASKRFERGVDPNYVLIALDRATMLIQQIAHGEVLVGVIDVQSKAFPEAVITCRLSRINQILGQAFSRGEVEDIFNRLQFVYQWDGQDQFVVRIPTYRGDIKGEIDLIEEVVRIYGYDNIPRQGSCYQTSTLPSTPIYLFEKEIRARLIAEGLQELLTCDLVGPTLLQIVQDHTMPAASIISVLNPTSIEQSILRTSLLPGLLHVAKYNFDHQNYNLAGFEIGRIHFHEGEHYKEQAVVGIILMGQALIPNWDQKGRNCDFFDLKGIVENLLGFFGISNYVLKNLNLQTFHSGRQASIFVDAFEIGSFGEIHPAIQRRLDIPQRILFGEFNLPELMQMAKPLEKVKSLPIYPSSDRDWTFTVKETVPFASICDIIDKQGSPILERVSLKDIYRDDKLGQGYQNLTLHFVYRDAAQTVEQEVVDMEHQRLTMAILQHLKIFEDI
jgi:phenylalanyl-tRNA synthetase beta chain